MCPTCRADVTVPCMSKKAAMSGVHSQRRTTSDENVGVLDDQCNQGKMIDLKIAQSSYK